MNTVDAIPCLAITGPTASGKTGAAMALAARLKPYLPLEIISVDSALVYRSMDIGTAKPSAAERAAVPHHLIDIRDPWQPYSAAAFVEDAGLLIADIRARGALPLLVGGTMLYFKALMNGLDAMPAADPAVRQAIETRAAKHGWPTLHAELATIDPVTAARLAPADSQRIQRALEVWEISGQPLSAFHATKKIAVTEGLISAGGLFSLEPDDRAWLHCRIAERFDGMLAGGLLDEVRRLRQDERLYPDLPAMRCVGYRQAWQTLEAAEETDSSPNLNALRETGLAATRQLAKRQITWLRSMPERIRIACDQSGAQAALEQAALALLNSSTR